MGKFIGKNISKNLSSKYSQKFLGHAKQSITDAFKTASERAIIKTAQATSDFISNEVADKIGEVSKSSQQNDSERERERVINGHDKKIPKERHISQEERQKIIDDLILI